MSWNEISHRQRNVDPNGVKIAITKAGAGFAMSIHIGAALAGVMNFKSGETMSIKWGDGDDQGKLAIAPSAAGGFKFAQIKDYALSLKTHRIPTSMRQDKKIPATWCEHEKTPVTLIITLATGLRAATAKAAPAITAPSSTADTALAGAASLRMPM